MPNVASKLDAVHLLSPEIGRPRMAKALLRDPEMADSKTLIGAAIQRSVQIVGWSNKEAAAKVGVDDAQFGKWISGRERPQMDKLWSVPELRIPLVQAFAEQCERESVEIRTVITLQQKVGA